MLTGGFYVSHIPVWIAWVRYIGFIYYGWNLLLYFQYQVQTPLPPPLPPHYRPNCHPHCHPHCRSHGHPPLPQGRDLPDYPSGMPRPESLNPVRDSMVLLGMLIVLRVWIYFVLKKKTSS